ncbi:MAG: hypothetical protein U0R27_02135 [Candidatus Nanopelagicales bacterium]
MPSARIGIVGAVLMSPDNCTSTASWVTISAPKRSAWLRMAIEFGALDALGESGVVLDLDVAVALRARGGGHPSSSTGSSCARAA